MVWLDTFRLGWLDAFRLKSSNPKVRCKAIENLAASSRSCDTERIYASLSDANPQVRCAAIRALEKRANPDSVASLIGALRDRSYEVREAAARALGRLKDSSAMDALAAALRDPDPAVRTASASALRALGWKPSTRDDLARFEIALGNTPAAIAAGDAAVDPLLAALTHETSFHRRAAAEALRELNDPRKIAPLLQALKDPDPTVRVSTIHSLGSVTSEHVMAEILKLFRDRDPHVRLAAAQVMARRSDSPPAHFMCLLEDNSFEVRLVGVQYLGRIRNPQVAEVLMPMLSDTDVDVRQATAAALGNLGNPSAVEALIIALTDEDQMVRKAAERSLDQLDPCWTGSAAAQSARVQLEMMADSRPAWVRSDILQVLARIPAPEQADQPAEAPALTMFPQEEGPTTFVELQGQPPV